MIEKINIARIIKDHINTLKDYETGKYYPWDFILFFIVPITISIILIICDIIIDKDMANALVTSLSIFAALLFNLLLLIYDITRKEVNRDEARNSKVKTDLLKQIFCNVSFSILISVFAISILLIIFLNISINISILDRTLAVTDTQVNRFLSIFIYFLITSFILTLFMVLKRVHVLLKGEF
ncbi:MAG: conserved membrane protein of unknown function [Methanothrix sp.]|jgi:Na+/melibiose symporter-like transporter|nr:MAG: conserved membrane protein of unknown function [Methanothrix sp.]